MEFVVMAALALVLLSIRALDVASILLAIVYGTVIWHLQGISWFLVLFTFLAISIGATKKGSGTKKPGHEQRGLDNVLSNGLVAFMSAVFGYPYFYLGSVSAALSDTLGSEIGMLSKEKPVLITNPKKQVDAGTDGGVSKLGFAASLAGAMIIAIVSFVLYPEFSDLQGPSRIMLLFAVFAGGISGSIADSLVGALFERQGHITNGSVNFLATLCGGIVTTVLVLLL